MGRFLVQLGAQRTTRFAATAALFATPPVFTPTTKRIITAFLPLLFRSNDMGSLERPVSAAGCNGRIRAAVCNGRFVAGST